ncbi:MAG: alpha/beta fold hydrolase [Alphaproteobacteria bacterium]|nr:alpha/beta fold hydrolase [Alphaproteobacteria bacterium]
MTSPAPANRPPPRQGPRPLALHLANASLTWLSSQAVLPFWKTGSLPWSPALAADAASLAQSLNALDGAAADFPAALERELRRRADLFLTGIDRYRHHPYRRAVPEMPLLWQEGTTRLLDYLPAGGAPLLAVPSLVNRYYILDLATGNSLLRYLAGQGIRSFAVDWDAPMAERAFNLTDYVTRLERAAEAAVKASGGQKLCVLGYCMGGLFAVALAARRPDLVSSLALLAVPWAFHAERPDHAKLLGALADPFASAFRNLGEVPVDVLQALFASLDPLLAVKKFTRFAEMPENSPAALGFVALEDWLNDGVALALPSALECLREWYGEDRPGSGEWRVGGQAIVPETVEVPSLVILPTTDRIVPPLSAKALGAALPNASVLTEHLGHIGMMVARDAPKAVWGKLSAWVRARA